MNEGGRFKSVSQGAATTLWCATSSQLEGLGGLYCENCDVARLVSEAEAVHGGVLPWAVDTVLSDRLWALSEQMTEVTLEP